MASVNFCSKPGSDLTVFDANGNGYDDLTCHTSIGNIQKTESHIVGNLTGLGKRTIVF